MQKRFLQGRDKELAKMVTMALTDEDKQAMRKPNAIREVTGRAVRGGSLCYQGAYCCCCCCCCCC